MKSKMQLLYLLNTTFGNQIKSKMRSIYHTNEVCAGRSLCGGNNKECEKHSHNTALSKNLFSITSVINKITEPFY